MYNPRSEHQNKKTLWANFVIIWDWPMSVQACFSLADNISCFSLSNKIKCSNHSTEMLSYCNVDICREMGWTILCDLIFWIFRGFHFLFITILGHYPSPLNCMVSEVVLHPLLPTYSVSLRQIISMHHIVGAEVVMFEKCWINQDLENA